MLNNYKTNFKANYYETSSYNQTKANYIGET